MILWFRCWSQQSCGSRLLWSDSFCGRGLRVLTLSDPGFPPGLRSSPAVQHLVSGKVGPEHSLLPPYRDSTLTKGLSPLESLESHTQSEANSRCKPSPKTRTAANVAQTASDRSRTCLFERLGAILQIDTFYPRGRCLTSAILEIAAGWAFGKQSAYMAQTFGLRD